MAMNLDIAGIAAAHGVDAAALAKSLADRGWDFSPLINGNEAHSEFATRIVTDAAETMAKRAAARKAAETKAAAQRLARMTQAARANPDLACGKCDGKGRLDCFGHIEKGICFWCKGVGIHRLDAKKR